MHPLIPDDPAAIERLRETLALAAADGDAAARAQLDDLDATIAAAAARAQRDAEVAAVAAQARRRARLDALTAELAETTRALDATVTAADAHWHAARRRLEQAWTTLEAAARAAASAGTLASAAHVARARVLGEVDVSTALYARNFGGAEFDAEEQGRVLRRAMREATIAAGPEAADRPWEPLAARLAVLQAEIAAGT